MESKISKGFSLVELVLIMGLTVVVTGVLMTAFRPYEQKAKARDGKRLSDISTLDRAVNEYRVDKGVYPDTVNILRMSTSLPQGNVGPLEKANDGWIDANLSSYTTRLPSDPINDATYHYSYKHNQSGYEINAVLEFLNENMQNDGGDDATAYEVGNDLSIL